MDLFRNSPRTLLELCSLSFQNDHSLSFPYPLQQVSFFLAHILSHLYIADSKSQALTEQGYFILLIIFFKRNVYCLYDCGRQEVSQLEHYGKTPKEKDCCHFFICGFTWYILFICLLFIVNKSTLFEDCHILTCNFYRLPLREIRSGSIDQILSNFEKVSRSKRKAKVVLMCLYSKHLNTVADSTYCIVLAHLKPVKFSFGSNVELDPVWNQREGCFFIYLGAKPKKYKGMDRFFSKWL